jgi:ribonuclease HI
MRTALYGAGGWTPCETIAHILSSFERKVLGLTLNYRNHHNIPENEFHSMLNRKVSFFMEHLLWTPLKTSAANLYFGWQGHVVRLEAAPIHFALHWRPAALVRGGALRRGRAGRPAADGCEPLSEAYGPFWEELALDRSLWREAKHTYLQLVGLMGIVGQGGGEWRFHKHISNRALEMLDGKRMLLPAPLMIGGDSQLVVRSVNGNWRPGIFYEHAAQVKRARWYLYGLEHAWKFYSMASDEPILVHRPRCMNVLADACWNWALDTGENVQVLHALPFEVKGCPVHLSFDGASRGNPGPAAIGAVVQVHSNGEWVLAACMAACIGEATSNCAEHEALVAGMRLLAVWCSSSGLCV